MSKMCLLFSRNLSISWGRQLTSMFIQNEENHEYRNTWEKQTNHHQQKAKIFFP